jgi:hypothetical protein
LQSEHIYKVFESEVSKQVAVNNVTVLISSAVTITKIKQRRVTKVKELLIKGLALIEAIKAELNKRDTIRISDNEFSKQYLDRSRSYISVIRHKGTDISESALLALYRNLNGLAVLWHDIAVESSMASSTRTWQNHLFYNRLSEVVWRDIAEGQSA